jgi:hypothetical protein
MRIEIVLAETQPVVRRVVEVPDDASLAVLHEVVQDVMGWEHSHLHEFEINAAVMDCRTRTLTRSSTPRPSTRRW